MTYQAFQVGGRTVNSVDPDLTGIGICTVCHSILFASFEGISLQ